MTKHRHKKRTYKMINFKVYFDTDADILDWWEGIEAGERSDAIRDLIRERLGLASKRKPKLLDLPELLEVRRDTLWIRDALNEMPAYLERVMQHIAATQVSAGHARASPPVQHHEPALSDADAERRTRRMRRATW